jgi:alpha-beta hydrolase superfamily lysophospholipase
MSEPTQSEHRGRGGRLVVHEWAPAAPRFLVLLAHGYGEHARRYDHVAKRLTDEGAVVVAPDHLGHGESEGERALVTDGELLVDDLEAVGDAARERHPGLPVVLFGHSMGGLLAARLAQRDPTAWDALVLSGPAIGDNPALLGLLAMDPIPDVPIDPAALSRDPGVGEAYAADPLVYHGPFRRETLEAFGQGVHNVAAGPSLGELPTLWAHGEEDPIVPLAPARAAVEHLRGAELEEHVYPGARHEILNETNQDEVLDDIVSFLQRALAESARR